MRKDLFLKPLKNGHHSALAMGLLIQQCAEKIQCDASNDALLGLREMVLVFFYSELKPHFATEESLMKTFGNRLNKGHSQRIRSEHSRMTILVQEGSLGALVEFSYLQAAHIEFEEKEFFTVLGDKLHPYEKEAVALYLGQTLPSNPVAELEKEASPG
jgi:hemerythrin